MCVRKRTMGKRMSDITRMYSTAQMEVERSHQADARGRLLTADFRACQECLLLAESNRPPAGGW
jgi:hypothetical protein